MNGKWKPKKIAEGEGEGQGGEKSVMKRVMKEEEHEKEEGKMTKYVRQRTTLERRIRE